MMNDDFLTRFQEPPSPAFAGALYRCISQGPARRAGRPGWLTLRNALAGLVAVVLVAACTYVLTAPRWMEVGQGLWVQERNSTGHLLIGSEPPSFFASLPMLGIEEAKAAADYEFKIPTWAPSELTLKGATVSSPSAWDYRRVDIYWEGEESARDFRLIVFQSFYTKTWLANDYRVRQYGIYAGKGSTRMTRVNGVPAVLIQGDWDYSTTLARNYDNPPSENEGFTWNKKAALQLLWREDEVVYRIYAFGSSASADDLLRMAESAR
jgi:hypothetical protein